MKKKNYFLFLFLFLLLILLPPSPMTLKRLIAQGPTGISPPAVKGLEVNKTTISAIVGENYLSLSGYSSPFAQIYLSSSIGNIKNTATADETGFFRFKFVFLPQKTGELSLIAEDLDGLASLPLFLPEPSPNKNIEIENVLMPPTLSISRGKVSPKEMNVASGKTYPNSKILLYLYSDPKVSFWTKIKDLIVKDVWAKTAPRLEVGSDISGNFEFNLPLVEPAGQNLFVAGLFYGSYSPKSFTLSYTTLSLGDKILLVLGWLLDRINLFLKSIIDDPTKIILLEIPLLVFLFFKVLLRGWIERVVNQE